MKKNILKHAPLDETYPNVKPAKSFVPDWYKKTEKHFENKKQNELPLPMSFKMCSSFSDSFILGYMMPLAVDIAIRQTEGGPSISWPMGINREFVTIRQDDKANDLLPTPTGYSKNHYTWESKHMIKIPKGYSALITHPLNRFDLPFLTLTGIVDGEMVLQDGNIPVFFKNDFEGIIPAGTPIAQIILFKTENWSSEIDFSILIEGEKNKKFSKHKAFGWYKQSIWKKKIYN
jgi:hypothetical protein